jgi:predicted glycoside hydrolase/deacetylase ChbG (UPF0249 family)
VSERVLVVNADDFGRSPGVNGGVIRAHEEGIVTSATMLVRWPAAEAAATYSRRSSLSVGLHVDLGEWEHRDGEWHALYELPAEQTPDGIAAEVRRQAERFERLTGRSPTHIDSHQHIHHSGPVRRELRRLGERLDVPVRDVTPGIVHSGAFHGQDGMGTPLPDAIMVEALVRTIETLPVGITELGCHPATEVDFDSPYAEERLEEVATLCDPRVRAAIDRCGAALRSFADLAGVTRT